MMTMTAVRFRQRRPSVTIKLTATIMSPAKSLFRFLQDVINNNCLFQLTPFLNKPVAFLTVTLSFQKSNCRLKTPGIFFSRSLLSMLSHKQRWHSNNLGIPWESLHVWLSQLPSYMYHSPFKQLVNTVTKTQSSKIKIRNICTAPCS